MIKTKEIMNNNIGQKTTFWTLVKTHITVPTLQRDYIYGARTEETEKVLINMLDTFKRALLTDNEETLDFVYGSESKAKEFLPLDGQQRLTTLFLLHFYAALNYTKDVCQEDFNTLRQFSYATRNCTVTFCNKMLIERHNDLRERINNDADFKFDSYLKDLDDFRNSYYTDPSVMSMIVVLDRIHDKFHEMKDIWEKLTSNNCPINFYLLDFGVFDLSDDLYNKMNSRGKPLTDFEIFKAKMHKCIISTLPSKADNIAQKMDTDWMQFIWESLGQTKELKRVDPAFMNIIQTIFRVFDYISGDEKQLFAKLDDDCLEHNMQNPRKICAFENVLRVFSSSSSKIPNQIKKEYNDNLQECINGNLRNNGVLYLYAIFVGLLENIDDSEFQLRFRHVRNLINNSGFEIREIKMTALLSDVRRVMQGRLCSTKALQLNKTSWEEEQEKDKHREVWEKLFKFEEIDEINGTLQAFSANLNESNTFDLSDEKFVTMLTIRLEKAKHFFDAQLKDEYERRSALLSIGNYAQSPVNRPAYRYFGILKNSWQNFTGIHRYDNRECFMETVDKIDILKPISDYIGNTSGTNTEHWRYYAIKYAKQITVGYRQHSYGYMYFPQVNSRGVFDDNEGYLDVCILQSSYYGESNVAWKMLNRLLDQIYIDSFYMYTDPHGGDRIHIGKVSKDAAIDIQPDGWHVYGIEPEELRELGLSIKYVPTGDGETEYIVPNVALVHEDGKDYVEEGEEILSKIAKKYPSLRK